MIWSQGCQWSGGYSACVPGGGGYLAGLGGVYLPGPGGYPPGPRGVYLPGRPGGVPTWSRGVPGQVLPPPCEQNDTTRVKTLPWPKLRFGSVNILYSYVQDKCSPCILEMRNLKTVMEQC